MLSAHIRSGPQTQKEVVSLRMLPTLLVDDRQ